MEAPSEIRNRQSLPPRQAGEFRNWTNSLKLLRIPFSVFLMPVYWFALLNVEPDLSDTILVFITIHLFVYPASNGYNSWYDRDEGSIGGIKIPPVVTRELWLLVLLFDFLSILFASLVNFAFAAMVLVYMMASKAYSWDKIRLKKFPVTGAITVTIFQGFWTYLMIQVGVSNSEIFYTENILMGIVSSLFLLGSYPMTQIYQHGDDRKQNVRSLSLMIGVNGTFIFSAVAFLIATILLIAVFISQSRYVCILIYLIAMTPVNIYFLKWYTDFKKGGEVITYERTMKLNAISSLLLSAAFIVMLVLA